MLNLQLHRAAQVKTNRLNQNIIMLITFWLQHSGTFRYKLNTNVLTMESTPLGQNLFPENCSSKSFYVINWQ